MNKKLQRDTKNKVIGGVCAGLANYFDIDVALVRVLFAIALLAFSAGFWIYVVLWIVMPAGKDSENAEENGSYVITEATEEQKNNKGSLTAGLILIGVGVLGLVHQYIPAFNWSAVWPVLLIVLGLLLVIPFNSNNTKKS